MALLVLAHYSQILNGAEAKISQILNGTGQADSIKIPYFSITIFGGISLCI
jgi:hypothetical protein